MGETLVFGGPEGCWFGKGREIGDVGMELFGVWDEWFKQCVYLVLFFVC